MNTSTTFTLSSSGTQNSSNVQTHEQLALVANQISAPFKFPLGDQSVYDSESDISDESRAEKKIQKIDKKLKKNKQMDKVEKRRL